MGVGDYLGGIGQNVKNSLSGNISKAVLCLRDPEKITANDEDTIADAEKANDAILKKTQAKLKKPSSGVVTLDDIEGDVTTNGFIPFQVQYNPGSIRLNSSAGMHYNRTGEGANSQIEMHEAIPATTLSCELLFDDTNIMDAFMLENNPITNLSVGNTYNAIKSAAHGDYSVKEQIEGFTALFASGATKQVIFFWSNMSFNGELVGAESRFTMFNKAGHPIRGTVSISIRQGMLNPAHYKAERIYWNNAFDRAFSGGAAEDPNNAEANRGGINAESGGSKLNSALNNNILNLRL